MTYCGGAICKDPLMCRRLKLCLAEQPASTPPAQNAQPPAYGALADGFGDPETLFNSRDWLRRALEAKGAKIVGGGIGCGQCDLDFDLEGCKFNVSLRPISPQREGSGNGA